MADENSGLTKIEVLWAEILQLTRELDVLGNKIITANESVGSTVTSLEESLSSLAAQMKELSASADGVLTAKQEELNKLIDLALAEVAAKAAQRDLEVVELISEAVENRINVMHEAIDKKLLDSIQANSVHIQTEANKHLVKATQAISRASHADKAIFVSVAVILILIFSSLCVYAGWRIAFLHYANSTKTAEAFIASPDGTAAIEFSKLNNIQDMLDCKAYKQTKQSLHTYCVPMDRKNNVSGWRIK